MFVEYVTDPLQYEFMRRALIEVILMGAVTGAIGTYIVLRGLSFIGDALSHAIFPGIVIAFLLGQSIFLGALVFGVLTSGSIAVIATNRRVKEDSAIGVLFAGTFALGVVLISSSNNFTRDLASFLFGNVLGVTESDIWLSAIVGGDRDRADPAPVQGTADHIVRPCRRAGDGPAGVLARPAAARANLADDRRLAARRRQHPRRGDAGDPGRRRAHADRPAAGDDRAERRDRCRCPVCSGLFISYHNDVAAGGTIVLVATAIFGLVWLFAPEHGLVSGWLLRGRLATRGEPEAVIVFESPEIQTPGRH